MKIGLVGVGTIGSGVIHIYQQNREKLNFHGNQSFALTTVCDLDFDQCPYDLSAFKKSHQYQELLDDPNLDIIIELIGGEEPALSIIKGALKAGKHVVTANKLIMAKYGKELLDLARTHRVELLYEAAVAGAIPIINPLKSSLLPNQIMEIVGILNGTTNFILTKMQDEGADYEAVLKEAQKLGYAEADPSSDVEGMDSQYKLAILASISFQAEIQVSDILVEGITKITAKDIAYTKDLDSVIKLLAIGRQVGDQIELRVHPVILGKTHPLASVNGVYNAIYVKADMADDLMFYGRGAGSIPTATSIWADLLNIINHTPYRPENLKTKPIQSKNDIISEYYFRFLVEDQSGVLAEISRLFADHQISIKAAIQKGLNDDAELVIVSHKVREEDKNKAIEKIAKLSCVKEIGSIIRVGI